MELKKAVTPYWAYLNMQTAGPVEKPEHYHVAEKLAIDYFFSYISLGPLRKPRTILAKPMDANILDVGCAIGLGMMYLEELGYKNVYGIDLDSRKIRLASEVNGLQNSILGDVADFDFSGLPLFDVIYCSHCLEHVYDADAVIEKMKKITKPEATFFFILPYPDLNPSPAHWSTPILGLDINDNGKTVMQWLENKFLVSRFYKLDDFREPEIWIVAEKV